MKTYVLQSSCGDYYCEGEHLVGVFSSEELAEAHRDKTLEKHPKLAFEIEFYIQELVLDAGPNPVPTIAVPVEPHKPESACKNCNGLLVIWNSLWRHYPDMDIACATEENK